MCNTLVLNIISTIVLEQYMFYICSLLPLKSKGAVQSFKSLLLCNSLMSVTVSTHQGLVAVPAHPPV